KRAQAETAAFWPPFEQNCETRLTFGELERTASLRPPILLAFHGAWIAGEEAPRLQRGAQSRLVIHQGSGDAVPHGAGLARQAAAIDGDDDVELAVAVGRDQRLTQDHAQHRTGEINRLVAAIDRDLAAARLDPDAGDRFLAAAGGIGAALVVALVVELGRVRGVGRLGLDQRGLEFGELVLFGHGQAAFVLYWVFLGFIAATS